jgi:hypothetical protein
MERGYQMTQNVIHILFQIASKNLAVGLLSPFRVYVTLKSPQPWVHARGIVGKP